MPCQARSDSDALSRRVTSVRLPRVSTSRSRRAARSGSAANQPRRSGSRLAWCAVSAAHAGVVVGYGGLGQLLFRGFRSSYHAEVMTATVLCLLLAFVLDLLLAGVGRAVTPWARAGRTGATT